jgi:hypothetical protein
MDADENFLLVVLIDSINRTGCYTGAAAYAQFLPDDNSAAFSLAVGRGGAHLGAGCRIAGKTAIRSETGR